MIDGDVALVGAIGRRDACPWGRMCYAGAVFVYRLADGVLAETRRLLPWADVDFGTFGLGLELASDQALVGATYGPDLRYPPGKVYVLGGVSGADCNGNAVGDACDVHAGRSFDANGNFVPDECEVPGDVDGSGAVDRDDLIAVIEAW